MAYVYAKTAGNWNTATNWQGGSVPTSSDDVFLNGLNMTIDGNINVKSINNNYATIIAPSSLTGTIAVSTSSTTVTGTSTLFTTELVAGQTIKNADGTNIGVISSITNDTTLILTTNSASTASGIRYVVSASTTSLTGTITSSTASTTVTGTGTKFQSELQAGVIIRTTGGTPIGTISSIASDTSLTLTTNGTSNTNISYVAGTQGGTATATLTSSFNPSITIGINGIFSGITAHVITIASSSIPSGAFNFTCTGTINGTSTANIRAIQVTASNAMTMNFTTRNIYGNTGEAMAFTGGNGTVTIDSSGYDIIGGALSAIYNATSSTGITIKCSLLKGGSGLYPAYLIYTASGNNTVTQNIGTVANPITNITPSTTGPAIYSYSGAGLGPNTVLFNIYCTNINVSGDTSNSIFPIQTNKYKLTVTNINIYDPTNALILYFSAGTSYASFASQMWGYLTTNTEFTTTTNAVGKLIKDNLNATVSSRAVPADIPTSNITAIKAKTDNLPSDPASNTQVNTRASQISVDTVAGYIDTEVAAIKTKTDNLPANTATELSTINTKLDTIDDYIDTEVAAIKTQTDKIPNYPASNESVTSIVANSIQSLP